MNLCLYFNSVSVKPWNFSGKLATDLDNNFSKGYLNSDEFTVVPATITVKDGNAYFYEPEYDTFSTITLNRKNEGITSMKFRLKYDPTLFRYDWCNDDFFWVPHFDLIFSDGKTIRVYPYIRLTGYYGHNPWFKDASSLRDITSPSLPEYKLRNNFFVFNYIDNTKISLGNRLNHAEYYEYEISINESNVLTFKVADYTYSTNIGSRNLVSIYMNPLSNWCGTDTEAFIDWFEYTLKD